MRSSLFDAMLATEDDDSEEPVDEDEDDPADTDDEDPDAEESEWDSSVDDGLRIDHFTRDE